MKLLLLVLLLVPRPVYAQRAIQVLHEFTGGIDGAHPIASVIQGPDGLLFGTTWSSPERGTFYVMTPDGAGYWTAYIPAFVSSNNPQGLVMAVDGSIYGITTGLGGEYGYGEIYRVDSALTPMHAFSGRDGAWPVRPLIRGPNEYLYGMTVNGGAYDDAGTIFRLALSGIVTTIHSFMSPTGSSPGDLIRAADGNLYGTTTKGGAFNRGTLFRVSGIGVVTLHNFSVRPISLIQASNGSFYGTTPVVETVNGHGGCIFRLAPDGSGFTTLRCLQPALEGAVVGTLLEASDGNFYGVTEAGGAHNLGTLFRLRPDGTLEVLWAFDTTAARPRSPLIQGLDGNLYGTTRYGGYVGVGCEGTGGCGVVYRYTLSETFGDEAITNFEGK